MLRVLAYPETIQVTQPPSPFSRLPSSPFSLFPFPSPFSSSSPLLLFHFCSYSLLLVSSHLFLFSSSSLGYGPWNWNDWRRLQCSVSHQSLSTSERLFYLRYSSLSIPPHLLLSTNIYIYIYLNNNTKRDKRRR